MTTFALLRTCDHHTTIRRSEKKWELKFLIDLTYTHWCYRTLKSGIGQDFWIACKSTGWDFPWPAVSCNFRLDGARSADWSFSIRCTRVIVLEAAWMSDNPPNQVLVIIFFKQSLIISQALVGMADGKMCAFGNLRHILGLSVLAVWCWKLGLPTTLALRSLQPGLKKSHKITFLVASAGLLFRQIETTFDTRTWISSVRYCQILLHDARDHQGCRLQHSQSCHAADSPFEGAM
jgi:hypothetical protein